MSRRHRPRLGPRLLKGQQHTPGLLQEHLPGRGQAHAPWHALKQGHAQVSLQLANRPRQGRLLHMQPPRRPAKVQFLAHRNETAKMAQVYVFFAPEAAVSSYDRREPHECLSLAMPATEGFQSPPADLSLSPGGFTWPDKAGYFNVLPRHARARKIDTKFHNACAVTLALTSASRRRPHRYELLHASGQAPA